MNRFIGIAMLLYGPINPTGVIPIYVSLVGKVEPAKAHRIILSASVAVVGLLAGALPG